MTTRNANNQATCEQCNALYSTDYCHDCATPPTAKEQEIDPRIIALAKHLELTEEEQDEIEEESDNRYTVDGAEYLVLTDYEAEDAWDDSIDHYIDDCILPEINAQYRAYFDYEKFKRDCSFDGRGHTLAGYDGEENDVTVDGVGYYIYRTN